MYRPGLVVYAAVTGVAALLSSASRPLVASAQQPAPAAAQQTPDKGAAERALLNRYCVTCHNDKLKTGGLALDTSGTVLGVKPRQRPGISLA